MPPVGPRPSRFALSTPSSHRCGFLCRRFPSPEIPCVRREASLPLSHRRDVALIEMLKHQLTFSIHSRLHCTRATSRIDRLPLALVVILGLRIALVARSVPSAG
jgi:hypothetical protein